MKKGALSIRGSVCLLALAGAMPVGADSSTSESPALEIHAAPVRAVDVFSDAHLLETPPALAAPPAPVVLLDEGFETESLGSWTTVGVPGKKKVTPATGGRPVLRARPVEETARQMQPANRPETLAPSREAPAEGAAPLVGITGVQAHGGRRSVRVTASTSTVLPRLERTLSASPETTYRLRGFVRTENLAASTAGASLEVVELGADPAGAVIVDHQHLPRERGTSLDWKEIEYTFTTSEATRHLRVILRAATGVGQGTVYFDDVTLFEIPRIVGFIDGAPFASTIRDGAPHPLLLRQRFGEHDERPAILAPVPTRWRLGAAPAADTLLRFALGVETNPSGATEACFRIRWRGTSEADLFERCVELSEPRHQPAWLSFDVDLGELAGEEGELIFETSGQEGDLAFWGNPRLLDRQREPGDERPNIVLIAVDTLRADHMGIEGYPRPTSPALDELARESVRYGRAYATSPWTAPSLASLLTGRYPAQHFGGIRIEREQRGRNPGPLGHGHASATEKRTQNRILGDLFRRATALRYHPIGPQVPTLAERLRGAGWDTVGFHSNFNSSGAVGLSRGFDRYQMFSGIGPAGAGDGVSLVRRFLDERRERSEEGPFFLLFHTQDPHIPYRLRTSLAETFDPRRAAPAEEGARPGTDHGAFRAVGRWAEEFWDWQRLRRGQARGETLERVVAFYDSEIAWADKALALLLEELENWPDTLIVFTADHGEEFGEHGQFEHGHSLYDEVLRVPLFLRLPDGRHAGAVVEDPVSLVDVAPTLLHLTELEPLADAEGRSLLAVGVERRRPRHGIFAEAMLRGADRTGFIADGYKYVYTHPRGFLQPFPVERQLEGSISEKTGREELYLLARDPGEENDLAPSEPGVLARLRDHVAAYLAETAHGVHLRCRAPDGLELEVAATSTLAHVKPLFGFREADEIEIDPTQRRALVRLATGKGEPWFVLRFFEPEKAWLNLRASAAGGKTGGKKSGSPRFFLGTGDKPSAKGQLALELGADDLVESPRGVEPAREPWCRVWQVEGAGAGSSRALDSAAVEQLRALGYL